MGDVIGARLVIGVRLQVALGAQHDVELLDHMDRQSDGARLVHDPALDALANPPGGIGRKAKPSLRVEFFDGVDQAEIALLDQIEQRHPAIGVVLGDVHHQAQVVLDHALTRAEITGLGQTRAVQLLLRAQEGGMADVVEVQLCRVREKVGAGVILLGELLIRRRFAGELVRGGVRVARDLVHDAPWPGRYCSGSTGFPRRRISKCSATRPASVFPISAIFCPLVTRSPSFTRSVRLCAYTLK